MLRESVRPAQKSRAASSFVVVTRSRCGADEATVTCCATSAAGNNASSRMPLRRPFMYSPVCSEKKTARGPGDFLPRPRVVEQQLVHVGSIWSRTSQGKGLDLPRYWIATQRVLRVELSDLVVTPPTPGVRVDGDHDEGSGCMSGRADVGLRERAEVAGVRVGIAPWGQPLE